MLASRRHVLAGMTAATLAPGIARAAAGDVLTPEAFGARGDGRSNDTDAFAALSREVNARGGGTIALRPVTYVVGRHGDAANSAADQRSGRFAFEPATILHFVNCPNDVVVQGNGAVLRAPSGLMFGTFDPRSRRPLVHAMPFTKREFRATPYLAMILAEGCAGLVEIRDLELDGNLAGMQLGGQYGDRGWQIPATGIRLTGNRGPERISNVRAHHHALDGLTLDSAADRDAATTVSDVRCDANGRQGCSVIGGRNYAFSRCQFVNTGRSAISSAPAAGVDIEAGRAPIRNVSFADCEFSNNAGSGLVADSGDTEGVVFDRCNFIGTTNRAAWPNKPRMRFSDCLFVGSVVRAYGDADPARAVQFHGCRFTDDPAQSPTGRVFGGPGLQLIADLPNSPNVLFDRCEFELTGGLALPMTTRAVLYSNCRMAQRSPQVSHPQGTYLGTSVINGNANLAGSIIRGEVILNGRTLTGAV